jgi:hypothetical protein
MAVREGVSMKHSLQDSKADITEKGNASSYMVFWSTVYNPTDPQRTYSTCVLVTGVTLFIAETVSAYESKTEKYVVGTEPCWCGPFSCKYSSLLQRSTMIGCLSFLNLF